MSIKTICCFDDKKLYDTLSNIHNVLLILYDNIDNIFGTNNYLFIDEINNYKKYIYFNRFITNIFDICIRKIQKWWKNIYYSPYTKTGIERFNKSVNKLYEENDIKIEKKHSEYNIIFYSSYEYNTFLETYIASYQLNLIKYFKKLTYLNEVYLIRNKYFQQYLFLKNKIPKYIDNNYKSNKLYNDLEIANLFYEIYLLEKENTTLKSLNGEYKKIFESINSIIYIMKRIKIKQLKNVLLIYLKEKKYNELINKKHIHHIHKNKYYNNNFNKIQILLY